MVLSTVSNAMGEGTWMFIQVIKISNKRVGKPQADDNNFRSLFDLEIKGFGILSERIRRSTRGN
jgi:hypothetical protein